MNSLINELTFNDLFKIFLNCNPRSFTKADMTAFAGVEGEAYMAELDDDSFIILDVTNELLIIEAYDLDLDSAEDGPCLRREVANNAQFQEILENL